MDNLEQKRVSRRDFLRAGLASSGLLLVGCDLLNSAETNLPFTPACDDGDDHDPTPRNTEGPFFTPNSPERSGMREPDFDGELLVVQGTVLAADCTPIPNALIDFWHADPNGDYDNEGYLFRSHQFSDADGNYRLETLLPGVYPGRTRHIHVKIQPPNGDVLTTQLYFPNEPDNFDDGLIIQSLIMQTEQVTQADSTTETVATFNFVLRV